MIILRLSGVVFRHRDNFTFADDDDGEQGIANIFMMFLSNGNKGFVWS
jgi:hypothetical protein